MTGREISYEEVKATMMSKSSSSGGIPRWMWEEHYDPILATFAEILKQSGIRIKYEQIDNYVPQD